VVVSERYIQQCLIPSAIEPRATVVMKETGRDGSFVVYTSTQVPHFTKEILSAVCGTPQHKVRVVAPDVGGGFGSKLNVYGEEAGLG
jgi:carbon-monoxide dehydrogenase large subunit